MYPTQIINYTSVVPTAEKVEDDVTVVTSNCAGDKDAQCSMRTGTHNTQSLAAMARTVFGAPTHEYLNAITIATTEAIRYGSDFNIHHGRYSSRKPSTCHHTVDDKLTGWKQG